MDEQLWISQENFRSEDHCHLCGEKLTKYDDWAHVVADEIFTSKEGRVSRKVKAQWHVDCADSALGECH